MKESLPKDCLPFVKSFAGAFDAEAKLGVKITATSNGKNRFALCAGKCIVKRFAVYFFEILYNKITLPKLSKLVKSAIPDYLFLKPSAFMPIDELVEKCNLDENEVARAIADGIKKVLKTAIKWDPENGATITLQMDDYWHQNDKVLGKILNVKSFNELMILVDLNVK